MPNIFKKILIFIFLINPTTCFAWHDFTYDVDWDYHGSGRDHPYSDYIDRSQNIGYADYTLIQPEYVEGPSYINNVVIPVISPLSTVSAIKLDEFTVNIPNARGGYTAVIIRRLGGGFTGPQGEYYLEFPTVQQLKVMYGK